MGTQSNEKGKKSHYLIIASQYAPNSTYRKKPSTENNPRQSKAN